MLKVNRTFMVRYLDQFNTNKKLVKKYGILNFDTTLTFRHDLNF